MAAVMPPLEVQPGWYWYDYDRLRDRGPYEDFLRANKGSVWQRRVFTTKVREAVVLQVTRPIHWTIGGKPTPAPRGLLTELSDMAQSPDASPGLLQMLSGAVDGATSAVGKATSDTSSTLRILLWGGAAILLFNLFRSTSPATPAPAPSEA